MFSITLQGDALLKGFIELPSVIERETDTLFVDMAEWIKNDLKARAPSETGKLRDSIRYEIKENGSHKEAVFHALPYGVFVDEGTGKYGPTGHVIKTSKVMAFEQHGQKWFHTRLEGQKPKRFTEKTFKASINELDRRVDAISERIFRAVIGG